MNETSLTLNGREEWLESRQRFIGSSDAPAILGCGYAEQSITSVWRSKIDVLDRGDPFLEQTELKRSDEENELMAEGTRNEPLVVQAFAMRHPNWHVDPGTSFDLRISQETPYVACSLDAWVTTETGEGFPLECKWIMNPSIKVDGEWVNEWEGQTPPLDKQIQVMHQMYCTGASRGCVAAFVRGKWTERWVDRDEEVIQWMLGEYAQFWQHVMDKTPPPEKRAKAMRSIRGQVVSGTAKLLGTELSDKVRKVLDAQKEMDKIRLRAQALTNSIIQAAGAAEFVLLDDGRCVKVNQTSLTLRSKMPRGVVIQ